MTEAEKSAAREDSSLPDVAPDFFEQDHPDFFDDIVPTRGYYAQPVVALGGSAGAIPALQRFFEAMPPDSGLAFVVVLHLSPVHQSSLPNLIERWTTMRVKTAEQGDKLTANSVYVIPPGKALLTTDGTLELEELELERGKRVAVDLFFRSLADTHGAHATAVVLSGADGDGAIGIKRIKERGGLTIAQDPSEAEHYAMPQSAITTGMVDWVLPAAQMPARVLDYFRREKYLGTPPQSVASLATQQTAAERNEEALREVLAFLRARTGRDFTYYKRATIVRRVARRIQVNALEDLPTYLEYLRTHPGEAGALLQDLLISVTNFFRDRDVFETFETLVPSLFKDKGPSDSIRVWVPACATGEEAYSIAMLLVEHARTLDAPPTIQIFGSDLDDGAIHIARAALYPDTISADVSEERLRRFFTKEARGYRIRREVREVALFATHDLLKNAPFSRMDLVSCRNLLIYLSREAQRRAIDILHFALRPEGVLMLGSSETVDEGSPLFEPIDKKFRIYRQRPASGLGIPIPAGPSLLLRNVGTTEVNAGPVLPAIAFTHRPRQDREFSRADAITPAELHFRLLERVGPPSLVVNADHEIVHLSNAVSEYLQFASGEPSINLLRVVHPQLRIELRAALFQAAESSEPSETPKVVIDDGREVRNVSVRVSPARELAPGFMLVTFQSLPAEGKAPEPAPGQRAQPPVVERLERELDHMKARLRENLEEYEANTEELKASNEELQAMNEELRSATEELETSREELQSLNEELATVNHELKSKLDELGHANSDLHNLMASTAIATIFLDRDLRIMRYTPSALELFRIIGSDIGRPLTDLRHRLDYPNLHEDARRVLANLAPIAREVRAETQHFLARILPYRTVEDRIAGVVLTFVDITGTKVAEEALRASEERLKMIVETARDYAIFSLDLERRVTSWNAGAQAIIGYTAEEAVGQTGDIVFTPEDRAARAPEEEAQRALRDGRATDERWHLRKDGARFWGSGVMMPMHDAQNRAVGFVKVFRDQTDERQAKEALERGQQELMAALREMGQARAEAEAAGRAKDHFLAVLSHELRTPLTPVLMATRALARRKDLPLEAAEPLAMIERNVQLEAQFIDDLLDVTRISRGRLDIMHEPVDVHEVIGRAVEVSQADIDSKKHQLSIDLSAKSHHVQGDARRLQQVFWNLIKNACKFTPHGGAIWVKTSADERMLRVEVRDNGCGFEPAASERIFAAFEQADEKTAKQFGGLGLGLAIAKATIEAHGGTIHASSEGPGKGAIFEVNLILATQEKGK